MKKIDLKNYLNDLDIEELYEVLYLITFKGDAIKSKTLDKYFMLEDFIRYLIKEERILYRNRLVVNFNDFWGYIHLLFKEISFYDFFTFCTQNYGITKAQIIKDFFVFLINLINDEIYFDKFFKFINDNGFTLKDFEDSINNMHSSSISSRKKSTYEMVENHKFILVLNTNILYKNLKLTLNDYNELVEGIDLVENLFDEEDEISRLAILKIKEKLNQILYK